MDEKEQLEEQIKQANNNVTMWRVELFKLCQLYEEKYGNPLPKNTVEEKPKRKRKKKGG